MDIERLWSSRKKIFFITVLVIFLGSSLVGCGIFDRTGPAESEKVNGQTAEESPVAKRPIVLSTERSQIIVYYTTIDGKYLVPVTISINPTKEVAQVAVEKLLAGPNSDFLGSPIPEGTKLREIYFNEANGTVFLDLTKSFLEMDSQEAVHRALNALMYTLGETPRVEQFQIYIDGQVIEELHGVALNIPIKKENRVNFLGNKSEWPDQLTVFFGDDNATYLVPISIDGPKTGDILEKAKVALDQLIKGPPQDSDLVSPIWKGTKILDLDWDEHKKILTIDFSKEIVGYGGGSALERLLVNSLLFTSTSISGIDKVQILIEGEKQEYLPEGTDIFNPLEISGGLNCAS